MRSCASPRRWRPNESRANPMDFTLSNEQRSWQMTARKFAEEEIRPLSLERDEIADPRVTFDWEIIKKGSKLGFRTLAVPKEWGGHGTDFVTQALVMAELAKAIIGSSTARTASSLMPASASCSPAPRAPTPTPRCGKAPPYSWCRVTPL